jgi:hypothetical protein
MNGNGGKAKKRRGQRGKGMMGEMEGGKRRRRM